MSNPLSALKIDRWWHAITAVGAFGMIAFPAMKVDFISQRDSFLIFLGIFFFGVGQWINHPIQVTLTPIGKTTGYHRNSYFIGVCFELLGGVIFIKEIYPILFHK